MDTTKKQLLISISLIFLGIILGAFGAHGLEGKVEAKYINTFEVGVKYQFYTAFGLMLLTIIQKIWNYNFKKYFNVIFIGMIVFSGSIYGLVLNNMLDLGINKILGPITPLGGLTMIVGWLLVFVSIFKENK